MRIEWSGLAVSDRSSIYDYIEIDSPHNAILVDDRIGKTIEGLRRFPEIGRLGRIEGTRELVVQRTPYIVAYLLDASLILILRILHGAQAWPGRLAAT